LAEGFVRDAVSQPSHCYGYDWQFCERGFASGSLCAESRGAPPADVLLLCSAVCLVAGQERAKEEQEEFIVRTGQYACPAAVRLAARNLAHQTQKSISCIVNNVIYTLPKISERSNCRRFTQQYLAIFKEEWPKADLIITRNHGLTRSSARDASRESELSAVEELKKKRPKVFQQSFSAPGCDQ
jgi:hypothetical protein